MAKRVERDAPGPEPSEPIGGDMDDLSEGAAIVASGAMLMRIENQNMQAVSVARPRNEDKILADALDELERYPDLAARNYYSIPFAETRGSDRTFQVEGPSINAAMSLARRWGNCSVYGVQVGEDEDKVYLSGVFLDLETNFRIGRPFTVSKYLKRKDGRTEVLRDQRLIMAIQSGASKGIRNAILAGLPDGFVESYYQRARSIAAREAKSKWAELIAHFRTFGVSQEMLEAHVGHPLDKITDNELADLRGIFNALQQQQAQPADIFGKRRTEDEPTTSVDEVVGSGAKVTGGAEAPQPIPSEGVIGEAGAVNVIEAANARAAQLGVESVQILAAVARFFEVADVTAIPDSMGDQAIRLVKTAEFPPDDTEEKSPTPEPMPRCDFVNPAGQQCSQPPGHKDAGFDHYFEEEKPEAPENRSTREGDQPTPRDPDEDEQKDMGF
jgi:hypothetical protein